MIRNTEKVPVKNIPHNNHRITATNPCFLENLKQLGKKESFSWWKKWTWPNE